MIIIIYKFNKQKLRNRGHKIRRNEKEKEGSFKK